MYGQCGRQVEDSFYRLTKTEGDIEARHALMVLYVM